MLPKYCKSGMAIMCSAGLQLGKCAAGPFSDGKVRTAPQSSLPVRRDGANHFDLLAQDAYEAGKKLPEFGHVLLMLYGSRITAARRQKTIEQIKRLIRTAKDLRHRVFPG
jgi:hypothetical protein